MVGLERVKTTVGAALCGRPIVEDYNAGVATEGHPYSCFPVRRSQLMKMTYIMSWCGKKMFIRNNVET